MEIPGLVRAHLSTACSHDFFERVQQRCLDDGYEGKPPALLNLAVVLRPDTYGTSVSVWNPMTFADTVALSTMREDKKVFKPTLYVHIAHPAFTDGVASCIGSVMQDITPTITTFAKGYRKQAVSLAVSIRKKDTQRRTKTSKSIQRLEESLCIGIRNGIRSSLARRTGVHIAPILGRNARADLTAAVMRGMSRSDYGVFDVHAAADNSFIVDVLRGERTHHIEVLMEYGISSGVPVPTSTDEASAVLVVGPNHQEVKGGQTSDATSSNGSRVPVYYVLGVPVDAVTMLLPRLLGVVIGDSDVSIGKMTARAFAPGIEFLSHGSLWLVGSAGGRAREGCIERTSD